MTDDEIAAARAAGYVTGFLKVLAKEGDGAVVLATLTSLVSLVLHAQGVPIEAFMGSLRESAVGLVHMLARRGSS